MPPPPNKQFLTMSVHEAGFVGKFGWPSRHVAKGWSEVTRLPKTLLAIPRCIVKITHDPSNLVGELLHVLIKYLLYFCRYNILKD